MANIAKTYTFVNSQPADATQVNKNFDDIIAGVGDTADLHPVISAAGAALIDDANAAAQRATLGAAAAGDSGAQCLSALGAGVTNLSFPIAANEVWVVDLYANVANNTAAGTALSIYAPAGCGIAGYQLGGGPTTVSPLVPSMIAAINTPGAAIGVTGGAAQVVVAEMHFKALNGTTAGTITLHVDPASGGNSYIYVGSYWEYKKALQV